MKTTRWLVDQMAALLDEVGLRWALVHPLVELDDHFFPEGWEPTADGVEVLCARLLRYAGLSDLRAVVNAYRVEAAVSIDRGAAVWFERIEDGVCQFGVDVRLLADPEMIVGLLCREVAIAYRTHHEMIDLDGEHERRLVDVTAVCLGFGILAVNSSYRYRASGYQLGSSAVTEWKHDSCGALAPSELAYLLAVQSVARGMLREEQQRIAGLLETNQAAEYREACREIMANPSVIARLRLPPRSEWPSAVLNDELIGAALERSAKALERSLPPIHRVPHSPSGGVALIGGILGVLIYVCLEAYEHHQAAGIAMFAGPICGLILGRFIGRAFAHDRCSSPVCGAMLRPTATSCWRCRRPIADGGAEVVELPAFSDEELTDMAMRAGATDELDEEAASHPSSRA